MQSTAVATGATERARARSVLTWMGGPLLAPLLVALVLRVGLTIAVPISPVWDGVIYARSADFLAHGLGFTRTAIDPDEPAEATAFYPVGFPAMLAPLRWLQLGRGLDLFAQSLAGVLLVVAAGLLGRRAGGLRIGRRAAWLIALWPGGVLLSASWLSEPFFALFVAAGAIVVAYARRRSTLRATAIAAVILGAGAYVRPTSLPVLIACALGLALFGARSVVRAPGAAPRLASARAAMVHVAAAVAIVLVVLSPWMARNALAFDAPVLVSTNGGANLLVGTRNEGTFARIPDELDCSGRLPEVERDRCRSARALDRIAAAPLDWVARGVLKLVHTFGHESAPAQAWGTAIRVDDGAAETARLWVLAIDRAWWLVFLSGAIAGAVILRRTRPRSSLQVAIFAPMIGVAALHFVFLGGDRYHAPIVAMMAVLAAIALDAARRPRADVSASP